MLPGHYFVQHSCIACVMVLKPMLAWSPRSLRNNDTICFPGNVLKKNNNNTKMLVANALAIADYYIAIIHCFTFADFKFHVYQDQLYIGQQNYKQKCTTQRRIDGGKKERRIDRTSDRRSDCTRLLRDRSLFIA